MVWVMALIIRGSVPESTPEGTITPFLKLKRVSTSDAKEDTDEVLDLAIRGDRISAVPEECMGRGVVPPLGLIGGCPLGVRGLNEGLDL